MLVPFILLSVYHYQTSSWSSIITGVVLLQYCLDPNDNQAINVNVCCQDASNNTFELIRFPNCGFRGSPVLPRVVYPVHSR